MESAGGFSLCLRRRDLAWTTHGAWKTQDAPEERFRCGAMPREWDWKGYNIYIYTHTYTV